MRPPGSGARVARGGRTAIAADDAAGMHQIVERRA